MADQAITEADWNAALQERDITQPETAPPAEQPPETKASETAATPAEQTPAAIEEPVDPYAGLHPEVKAKLESFDKLAAQQTQLLNQLSAATGRISAIQSQWDKARAKLEQPSQTQVAAAAKDPEKWAALKKDFPEWGEAINEFVEARVGSLAGGQGPNTEEIETLVAQRTAAATEALEKKLNEALVTVKHPTWKQEINTPEFAAWFPQQPAEVQALAGSRDGFDAIRLMDLYAEHKATPAKAVREQRQQRQAAAATTVKSGGNATATKSIEDMSPAELWEYEASRRAKAAA